MTSPKSNNSNDVTNGTPTDKPDVYYGNEQSNADNNLGKYRRTAQWDVLPQQVKQRHLVQTQGKTNQYLAPSHLGFKWQDIDEWIDSPETWTVSSATTFTIDGDVTSIYTRGLKLGWIEQNFGTTPIEKFGYVDSSAFANNKTTVTIVNNDDYTLTTGSLITDNRYSRGENPQDFPSSFDYATLVTLTPESGSFTNAPTVNACTFSMQGRTISFYIELTLGNPTGGMAGLFIGNLPLAPTRIETGQGTDEIGPVTLCPYTQVSPDPIISVYRYDGGTPFVDDHILTVNISYLV